MWLKRFWHLVSLGWLERPAVSSDFVSRFSHELRTQLTGIVGYAEFLEKEAREAREAQAPMTGFTAQIIRESGENVTQILGAYCDLIFLINGGCRLVVSRFKLSDLLDEVVRQQQVVASARHIELSFMRTSEVAECYVSADMRRLHQMLVALLSGTVALLDEWSALRVVLRPSATNNFLSLELYFSDVAVKSFQMRSYGLFWRNLSYEFRLQEGPGVVLALARKLLFFMDCRVDFFERHQSDGPHLVLDFPFQLTRAGL